jgi:hypothetical protein
MMYIKLTYEGNIRSDPTFLPKLLNRSGQNVELQTTHYNLYANCISFLISAVSTLIYMNVTNKCSQTRHTVLKICTGYYISLRPTAVFVRGVGKATGNTKKLSHVYAV